MADRHRMPAPAVGGSSLLVIFAVLCLTVFALLALSTAQAGQRMGRMSRQAVTDYYQADCRAEEILARLRAGERPEGVREEDGLCSYACVISDSQTLEVTVRLEGDGYTVLRWQAVPAGEWQPDDALTVWDGELPQ